MSSVRKDILIEMHALNYHINAVHDKKKSLIEVQKDAGNVRNVILNSQLERA